MLPYVAYVLVGNLSEDELETPCLIACKVLAKMYYSKTAYFLNGTL
jgi:hypothetical protein